LQRTSIGTSQRINRLTAKKTSKFACQASKPPNLIKTNKIAIAWEFLSIR
jgi:hypothetical protein